MIRQFIWLLTVAACGSCAAPSHAENHIARALSDQGLPLMAIGAVANGLTGESKDRKTILYTAEAVAVTGVVVAGLKPLIGERRPGSLATCPAVR